MSGIEAADKVEIQILVDNATDMLSSNPPFVESEAANLTRRGFKLNAYKCLCCAVHGLSCLVTVHRGDVRRTVLFDTGPEDYAFERNVTRLGVDLGAVESIVLSHGHADHAGAMLLALGMIRGRNGGRDVPFYAHPGMFMTRGVRQPNGNVRQMEDVPSLADLTDFGAAMVVTTEPQSFLDGHFYVSGEIPRVTAFERGFPGQMRRTAGGWEPDELLIDERWLAVNVAGKGLVLFSACSHANSCRDRRAASLRPERGGDPGHGRGAERVRPQNHRGRSLHGLARHGRARERFSGCPRAHRRRQAVYILNVQGGLANGPG